jgi:hypothetical protein
MQFVDKIECLQCRSTPSVSMESSLGRVSLIESKAAAHASATIAAMSASSLRVHTLGNMAVLLFSGERE